MSEEQPTDTPRTDAARKGDWVHYTIAMMLEREIEETENEYLQTAFALTEQTERAERAEAEVERLRVALQSCYWATNTYDGNYTRACDNVATIAIEALKTQGK
jgi:hypothetical protein